EALPQAAELFLLTAIERHALAVLAQPHHRKAEVGLDPLLVEAQPDQLAADEVRQHRSDNGIRERRPHEIARNIEAPELERSGQSPQDDDEGDERHDGREQAEREAAGVIDEEVQVLRNALVGVVGAAVEELHAVVRLVLYPILEEVVSEPGAPLDLQHLQEPLPVYGHDDPNESEHTELAELEDEIRLVLLLEGVVEIAPPVVEQDIHVDHGKHQSDNEDEQAERLAALLRHPVGLGKCPESL